MRRISLFNREYFRKLSLWAIILLLLFVGCLILFVYLKHEVIGQGDAGFDNRVLAYMAAHVVSPTWTPFMKAVTWFASATFLQIAYGAFVLVYLFRKKWRRAAESAVIGLGGFLINTAMKLSFERVRPPDPLVPPLKNFSFPSGHATSAFIFYGMLAYLLWKTHQPRWLKILVGTLLILFSGLIGFSRVYLRVHYLTDVIAGFCCGFAWLLLTLWLFEALKKQTGEEVQATATQPPPVRDQAM